MFSLALWLSVRRHGRLGPQRRLARRQVQLAAQRVLLREFSLAKSWLAKVPNCVSAWWPSGCPGCSLRMARHGSHSSEMKCRTAESKIFRGGLVPLDPEVEPTIGHLISAVQCGK